MSNSYTSFRNGAPLIRRPFAWEIHLNKEGAARDVPFLLGTEGTDETVTVQSREDVGCFVHSKNRGKSMRVDLSIRKLNNKHFHRPWLIKREGGEYRQHAHLKTQEDAERVRDLITQGRKAPCRDYRIAMQRILTPEEYGQLNAKPKFHRPQRICR